MNIQDQMHHDCAKKQIANNLTLYGRRGIACKLLGFTFGKLDAHAFPLDSGNWSIRSDCGVVSITCNARLVNSRIAESDVASFYYD